MSDIKVGHFSRTQFTSKNGEKSYFYKVGPCEDFFKFLLEVGRFSS